MTKLFPLPQPDEIDFHSADGVFFKHILIPLAGSIVPQHAHEYPHTTFLAHGALFAWADGVPLGRFQAPAGIYIEAKVKHLFQTVADDTIILCVHNALHAEGAGKVFAEHEVTLDDVAAVTRMEG